MSSQTAAASEEPRVVCWPLIHRMQGTYEHSTALTVFTNLMPWKRKIVAVYQMSNIQVKAIVLSLVAVV